MRNFAFSRFSIKYLSSPLGGSTHDVVCASRASLERNSVSVNQRYHHQKCRKRPKLIFQTQMTVTSFLMCQQTHQMVKGFPFIFSKKLTSTTVTYSVTWRWRDKRRSCWKAARRLRFRRSTRRCFVRCRQRSGRRSTGIWKERANGHPAKAERQEA